MIIVFDGPEKAGKSTLVQALYARLVASGYQARIRKFTERAQPDDRVYAEPMAWDTMRDDIITLWDRSWASEYVYGTLLGQDRRLSYDPFLGDWLYGRAAQTCGLRVMVHSPVAEMAARRDATDLPVGPLEERGAFTKLATENQWLILENRYTHESLQANVNYLMDYVKEWEMRRQSKPFYPPQYTGPLSPRVLIVGDLDKRPLPGGWLPFSGVYGIMLGRRLSNLKMLEYTAWVRGDGFEDVMLEGVETVVYAGGIGPRLAGLDVIQTASLNHPLAPRITEHIYQELEARYG